MALPSPSVESEASGMTSPSDKPITHSEPLNIPIAVTKVEQSPPLLIKKLSDKAKLPTRGSAFAAGYDIYASKETVIPARGKALVDTDISMAVPAGTCMYSIITLLL
jgi:dUTP pyrophosphatase